MPKMIDLTGKKVGMYTFISRDDSDYRKWNCRCDCGIVKSVFSHTILSGRTISCGCHRKAIHSIHGQCVGKKQTQSWKSWVHMIRRCTDPKDTNFRSYGGKGITVCDKWRTFVGFFEDMGDCPAGYSIDRIDFNGNYELNNCRWASRKEQENNKSTNCLIEYNGETKTLQQWAEFSGLSREKLQSRLQMLRWDIGRALTTP